MGSPASRRISVPGGTQDTSGSRVGFHLRDWHPLWLAFQHHSISHPIGNSHMLVLQPQPGKPGWFGLIRVRSPLLAEWSLFLWVLRCFSSPGCLRRAYVFSPPIRSEACAPSVGFPIRTSPDERLHTATRGLSQCSTSFIGTWRQGIHRTPLVAYVMRRN